MKDKKGLGRREEGEGKEEEGKGKDGVKKELVFPPS